MVNVCTTSSKYVPSDSVPTLKARALAARMRREAVTTSAPALAIQSAARRYLARRRFNHLVKEKQIEWEWSTMAAEMARFCAERARLRYHTYDKQEVGSRLSAVRAGVRHALEVVVGRFRQPVRPVRCCVEAPCSRRRKGWLL